jgi:hypothetical protein
VTAFYAVDASLLTNKEGRNTWVRNAVLFLLQVLIVSIALFFFFFLLSLSLSLFNGTQCTCNYI